VEAGAAEGVEQRLDRGQRQKRLGVSIPHCAKVLARVRSEFYIPAGSHARREEQVFLTPDLVVERIPLPGRIGLTVGAGYQIAPPSSTLIAATSSSPCACCFS